MSPRLTRSRVALSAAVLTVGALVAAAGPASAQSFTGGTTKGFRPGTHHDRGTTTPIKHLVVIFQENVSFDHYFATYPTAANLAGETLQGTGVAAPAFTAAPRTPQKIDTLERAGLLGARNPNAVQPFRLTPGQAVTCDQDHNYTAEQKAYNGGAMDKFVENTSRDQCSGLYGSDGLVMGYYDGNTVTGLWNYAQHYAMSDNSYSTTFGPSTPGALNLISGQTHGVRSYDPITRQQTTAPDAYTVKFPDAAGVGTVTGDPDPVWDDCSSTKHPVAGMSGTTTTPRAFRGAGSRAASARPRRRRPPPGRCAVRATPTSRASRRPTTARTTSLSSTTGAPRTRGTCRRARRR